MQITRSRKHLINMTNYENVEFGAAVTLETGTEDDASVEEAIDRANLILDNLLEDDLAEAIANVPSGESTHAETWRK